MSSSSTASTFELQGEYQGFIRTLLGKKRMVLRTGRDESFLKVAKDLRHHLQTTLPKGTAVTVSGTEILDDRGRVKLVVSEIRLTATGASLACVRCPIRVCAKKNCWRNGGQELFRALQSHIAQRGAGDQVAVEAVRCLDQCDRRPNAEWRGHEFHHCTPMDAARIVSLALGEDGKSD